MYAKYNIRRDAYSRAIQGQSSGGIAAFNVAWNHPDEFSRVYTVVGSFTALQWRPGEIDGGNIYPFKVRREPKRNLRVWMNDGSEDQETNPGSWPLQNIQLANSLKLKGYDFHFSFGGGIAPRGARRLGAAGVPHLAVARLRSEEDRTDLRAERRGEIEAAVPRPHLQSLRDQRVRRLRAVRGGGAVCRGPSRSARRSRTSAKASVSLARRQAFAPIYGRALASLQRSGHTVGTMDLLIATAALADGASLVTRNVSEFSRVHGLHVVGY